VSQHPSVLFRLPSACFALPLRHRGSASPNTSRQKRDSRPQSSVFVCRRGVASSSSAVARWPTPGLAHLEPKQLDSLGTAATHASPRTATDASTICNGRDLCHAFHCCTAAVSFEPGWHGLHLQQRITGCVFHPFDWVRVVRTSQLGGSPRRSLHGPGFKAKPFQRSGCSTLSQGAMRSVLPASVRTVPTPPRQGTQAHARPSSGLSWSVTKCP
jgi:hypothetical protein